MKYAITHAKIYTCDSKNSILEDQTILVEGGKISQIIPSQNQAPADFTVIDATGKVITPGFIDSHTHQGLFDGTVGRMGIDGNEMTNPATPMMRAIDGINTEDPGLKEAVEGGVTTIQTGPGSGNVIGGECAVIKTWNSSPVVDNYILRFPSALKAAMGENPKRVYGTDKKLPSTRMGIAAVFRKAFLDAQNYAKKWTEYESKKKNALKSGKAEDIPTEPERDLAKETILKVINKEIPMNIHCHQHNDIVTAIRLAEEFDLNLMLIHATEGHKIANFIAEKHIPVSVGPSLVGFEKSELRDISFTTPAQLWKAGIKISIQSDSYTRLRYFHILPCMAVSEGLPISEALKAVTCNAAEMLGVADRIGSIAVGKDADLVIWSDHPIANFYAKNELVMVSGEIAYQKSTATSE